MDTALIALTSALLTGVVATAGARRVALGAGIVNAPNPIVHDHTTLASRLGGTGEPVRVEVALTASDARVGGHALPTAKPSKGP